MKHRVCFGSIALAVVGVAACGDSVGDDGVHDAFANRGLAVTSGGEECTAIRAPASAALPHVSSGGERGEAVVSALAALLAAEEPPVAAATQTYAIDELSCGNIRSPSVNGFRCSFSVSIDGGAPVEIATTTPSDLAESLFIALADAGADDCNDRGHGDFLNLSNVAIDVGSSTVEFDDASNHALPPKPNVRASGPEGAAVVDAMEAAGINDCDPSRTVFIVCNEMGDTPQCSRTFYRLDDVGGSYLVPRCAAPRADGPTLELAEPEALTLWNAMLEAAAVSGYVPERGTLEQVTLINAEHFTWDGATVEFVLFADNVTPPPPPPPRPLQRGE